MSVFSFTSEFTEINDLMCMLQVELILTSLANLICNASHSYRSSHCMFAKNKY